MKKRWKVIPDYFVEVWFRIEKDKEGYPQSKEWEQLLARPVLERDSYFQIESVPFYLKNISRGDIVETRVTKNKSIHGGEVFEFRRIVKRGGHNTYRLLLRKKHPKDPKFTTSELLKKGMVIEESHGDFFAVDVPPSVNQPAIDEYLVGESEAGRWELQDGCLQGVKSQQHIKTR